MTKEQRSVSRNPQKRVRYDFNELKANIPIARLARDLGLHPQRKGPNLWCSVRPEDHEASVILHEDTNRFHDFGVNRGGDVIDFAAFVMGLDLDAAQAWLGQTYQLTPKFQDKTVKSRDSEMTDWEYKAIGISGDLATKNFRFNTDKLTPDILKAISDRYSMTMNELRKAYPNIYTSILIQKALPYIQELRNEYLLSLWNKHQLVMEIGNPDLFRTYCERGAFVDEIEELERAEHLLLKAAKGTSLKYRSPRKYDPISDLQDMLSDRLKPQLGTLSSDEMKEHSQATGSKICFTEMDYRRYSTYHSLLDFPHTASWHSGMVQIGYLEQDHALFQDALTSPLHEMIASAETRKGSVNQNQVNRNFYEIRS